MGVLGVVARRLDALVGPGVMLLFPLYASMRAIESPSSLDDQQWLTYWVLYSFITLFELSFWRVLAWLPFWPYIKLLFCMWLVLPIFNGAAYIYENYVRTYMNKIGGPQVLMMGSSEAQNYPEDLKKALRMMNLESRKSVEHFVNRYGNEAFLRVIKAAEREAKKQKPEQS